MLSSDYLTDSSYFILKKVPNKVISWITVVLFLFSLFIICSVYLKYRYYINYSAVLVEEEHLKIQMELIYIPKLSDYQLIINQKLYLFDVVSINEIGNIYEVIIKIKENFKNKYFDVRFQSNQTTLYQEFVKKMKGND